MLTVCVHAGFSTSFSESLPAQTMSASQRRLVRFQHVLIFPVLFFARISWCIQSVLFPLAAKHSGRWERFLELGSLAIHYSWLVGASLTLLTPVKVRCWVKLLVNSADTYAVQAAVFIAASEFLCGLLLGFVFVQSHNGMEVFSDNRDFVRSQLSSTRDVSGSLFNDWFTGGLNRQIEHHLFPTLPRHNLHDAQRMVYAFCSKHGLYYEVRTPQMRTLPVTYCDAQNCSMTVATARVLMRLVEVARAA